MSKPGLGKQKGSALEKALKVLEAVADQPQPVGLPDLTMRLGLPRQTLHRILQQLEENGLVTRDPIRDRFSVGARLSHLALVALRSANQGAAVKAVLQDLVDDIRETSNVGVLDGLELIYLERIECDWPLRIHLTAGSRVPAYCTSGGKVLLAHLPTDLRARLLRAVKLKAYTPNTITRPARLEREFALIRERGYALNDQEFSLGIVGMAVPILDEGGRPLASLAIHAPAARLSLADLERHLPKLQAAAKRLAHAWSQEPGGAEDVYAAGMLSGAPHARHQGL